MLSIKDEVETSVGASQVAAFVSTHPTFETRARRVQALSPQANLVRDSRHCDPLTTPDPMRSVEVIRDKLKQLEPIAPGARLEILKDQSPGQKRIKLYK